MKMHGKKYFIFSPLILEIVFDYGLHLQISLETTPNSKSFKTHNSHKPLGKNMFQLRILYIGGIILFYSHIHLSGHAEREPSEKNMTLDCVIGQPKIQPQTKHRMHMNRMQSWIW